MAKTRNPQSARRTNLEDVGRRMDEEVEEFIRWFNQAVVPKVRRHSSDALRKASVKLADFADYMDDLKKKQ